jgi:hypothetical protein
MAAAWALVNSAQVEVIPLDVNHGHAAGSFAWFRSSKPFKSSSLITFNENPQVCATGKYDTAVASSSLKRA